MTYRIKVPPRTLPVDEAQLITDLEHRLIGMKRYRWPLLIGGLLVILGGSITWGVFWYEGQAVAKAQDMEREATLHYLTRPSNDPKKIEMNLKEAVALYGRIVEEYPRTPSAPIALFHMGNALYQSNEIDAAIDAYKRFIANYGSSHTLVGLVHQKLGYAYLLKGDIDHAATAYSAVKEMNGADNADQALFELARIEEGRGNVQDATGVYQELIKTYPNSPLANEAALRVKVLEARTSSESGATTSTPPSTSSQSSTTVPTP